MGTLTVFKFQQRNIELQSSAHSLHRTLNSVISDCRLGEDVKKCTKIMLMQGHWLPYKCHCFIPIVDLKVPNERVQNIVKE